jgi:dimethylglycine dehydrogenase
VTPEFASPGQEVEIRILGEPHLATVVADSPYDPANAALRS